MKKYIDPKEIIINGTPLSEIIENHEKWLIEEEGGVRANLVRANLVRANLVRANLESANLESANLESANLESANLYSANLESANIESAKNIEFAAALTTITPEGDLIGWKKLSGGLIAKLLIPMDAKRSNATGRKCRAEFAKVLEIWNGNESVEEGESQYDTTFIYKVGEIVKPTIPFDENRWEECSTGIHFFITKIEAERYY